MSYRIIQDLNETDPPKEHEKQAARILAEYFKSDLEFIRKGVSTTPDIRVIKTDQIWELKCPLGNGKRTMANNLRLASKQSSFVIIDLSRCKMNNKNALARIRNFMQSGDAHIKKLLIIEKGGEVVDYSVLKR